MTRLTHPEELCSLGDVEVSGEIKGKNGRPLTSGDRIYKILKSFKPGEVEIVAKNYKTRKTYKANVVEPFSWSLTVPSGDYKVFLRSKRFRITSRPKNYRRAFYRNQGGIHHALRRRDLRALKRENRR